METTTNTYQPTEEEIAAYYADMEALEDYRMEQVAGALDAKIGTLNKKREPRVREVVLRPKRWNVVTSFRSKDKARLEARKLRDKFFPTRRFCFAPGAPQPGRKTVDWFVVEDTRYTPKAAK